jgi:voltage-gated sodium channel
MPTNPAVQAADVASWRLALMRWLDASHVQGTIIAVILLNAVILGLEATPLGRHASMSGVLTMLDRACLVVFVIELLLKAVAHRTAMLRSGWNIFDILVVAIALVPAAGPFAVLRSLRVLRVFRLLTTIPSLRRVVAAFIHAIPGLGSVIALLSVFFFVAAVMATGLFGADFPEWFGHLGRSLYTLFQIMTLESWSMGIVRPIMVAQPWAWAFFVPFIMLATFTILNLFIGIIVSTMQELGAKPTQEEPVAPGPSTADLLARIERDIAELRRRIGS